MSVEMKYALLASLVAAGAGYYIAMKDMANGICKDPAFATTNAPALYGKCGTTKLSTYELIQYAERLGTYSTIPK